ncbi:tRNA (adenosine(37)-N6)-dimethylallyltransferase MiaA [Texcoconibacillus texcoconensis]|uniref:tRNA dimethylallyltransferase n=1 Tax=Texcoconibacillus texcoconensis TaxID=1095777 RepID=A0A840QKN6_9BACI|nr:tRNA (adenosine(37)-N6)-dimethylallyltransferase MiaA [Texcoconibacillus texcoconensis]MBB5171987.1 tRNA dimethylallyltransferase [Texcoconibacillus texcoconensis]
MEKLIAIVGPTAVGKTKIGIELANRFNGEVISGDSMQVYRGMDIGTAKVTEEEMEGVPHHLIDCKEPTASFSVAEFQQAAEEKIKQINQRGKTPFLVGGTGLYVNSIIYGYQFSDVPEDAKYRAELEDFAAKHGNEALYERLQEVDPKSAEQIHPNNVRRVIRALEVASLTGTSIHGRENTHSSPRYDVTIIGLDMERSLLYERINQRVDLMVEQGLVEEAKRLYDSGVRDCQSVQAIGYKEIYEYLQGDVSLEEAVETLKRNTRRFAKRQLTWFKNKMDVEWFDMNEGVHKNVEKISNFVAGK